MKKLPVPLIITLVINTALIVGLAIYRKLLDAEGARTAVMITADCLTFAGAIVGGVGALSWIGSKGEFDAFGYLFSKFSFHNVIPVGKSVSEKKKESYYDYTARKRSKARGWLVEFLITGLADLAVAGICIAVYTAIQ